MGSGRSGDFNKVDGRWLLQWWTTIHCCQKKGRIILDKKQFTKQYMYNHIDYHSYTADMKTDTI